MVNRLRELLTDVSDDVIPTLLNREMLFAAPRGMTAVNLLIMTEADWRDCEYYGSTSWMPVRFGDGLIAAVQVSTRPPMPPVN